MWSRKYKPKSIGEIIGHPDTIEEFLLWFKNWKVGSKACLIHGPTGSGKTSFVEAVALENNLDLIQMNASDHRTRNAVESIIGETVKQASLFNRGKLILIDEIDGLSGEQDKGGITSVIEIIKKSKFPIILTVDNPWDPKFRTLRNYCLPLEFKKIPEKIMIKKLEDICYKEGVHVSPEILMQIAAKSEGDLRSAINDLQVLSDNKNELGTDNYNLDLLGDRERKVDIFKTLKNIFKTESAVVARRAVDSVDKTPEELFFWIENNITNEYEKDEEVAMAFDMLSLSDTFRRINTNYMLDFMSAGVAVSKDKRYDKFTTYSRPQTLWNSQGVIRKSICRKIASKFHCSTSTANSEYLPFLKIIFKNAQFSRNLNLDEEEIDFMKNSS